MSIDLMNIIAASHWYNFGDFASCPSADLRVALLECGALHR